MSFENNKDHQRDKRACTEVERVEPKFGCKSYACAIQVRPAAPISRAPVMLSTCRVVCLQGGWRLCFVSCMDDLQGIQWV